MDDKRIDRLENKLDALFELNVKQSGILERHSVLHEKNTEDLATHIKRTDLIEARIEQQDKANSAKLDEALIPIKFLKMLVAVSLGGAAILGLFKIIKQVIGI